MEARGAGRVRTDMAKGKSRQGGGGGGGGGGVKILGILVAGFSRGGSHRYILSLGEMKPPPKMVEAWQSPMSSRRKRKSIQLRTMPQNFGKERRRNRFKVFLGEGRERMMSYFLPKKSAGQSIHNIFFSRSVIEGKEEGQKCTIHHHFGMAI